MTMPQDIKVLLVGDFPPPNGGIATHLDELRRAVRDHGARCEVLDIGKGQLPADGVIPAGGPVRFSGLLSSYAARGFRIHVHTGGDNPKSWMLAWACAVAGRLSGLEPILTLHSGLLPVWLSGSPGRRALARAIVPRYGKVIAVAASQRAALAACGVHAVEVLPAFTGRFLQPGSPPPGLRELRDSASPLYCAMAVTSRPVYGLQVLLRGFAEVRARKPRAVLAIYGPGTEELSGDGVRGFGELHRAQALALLAACDVFVRPTLADGDSVSVREALALGRAVVATSVGHRPEGVLLVPPGDAAALSAAMIEAVEGSERRPAEVPADSLQRILSLYGVTACAVSAAS
jgi:glycogen(starch) synthase